ncbi:hypothetical protein H0W80_05210 [Candidatus Saccharibacteria bacterium]|nr:hypothetical protein [Candidatus Saccharibacteria bacterium]
MTSVYVSEMTFNEITRRILEILKQLEPLSPAKIKKTCEVAWGAVEVKASSPSNKLLLNTYFNQALGFNCGLEKVAEQDGKKKLLEGMDYDLIFHISAQTNAIQSLTLRLPAPLSVCNFLNFQSATRRPKPDIKPQEIQAMQAGAFLKGIVNPSAYRSGLILKSLQEDIDLDQLRARSAELHVLGIYSDEVIDFLELGETDE